MIAIGKGRPGKFSGPWTVSLTMLALLYTPVSPGSGTAWAQVLGQAPAFFALPVREPTPVAQERQAIQGKPGAAPATLPVREPTRVAHERQAVQRKSDAAPVEPVALPIGDLRGGALGTALAACEKESENAEALTLPGARGEVKLDRCYRGRDHLVCSLNALLGEASALIEQYGRIVEAHYTDVNNLAGVCGMKPDALATDLQNANDFTNRFKALKAEYDARSNCGNRIVQSLKDVTLPDMAQAPEILKSMIDSLEGDLKGVSVVQTKVVELAERVDSSRKAISTIQKIHRTMCVKDQRALSQISDSTIR